MFLLCMGNHLLVENSRNRFARAAAGSESGSGRGCGAFLLWASTARPGSRLGWPALLLLPPLPFASSPWISFPPTSFTRAYPHPQPSPPSTPQVLSSSPLVKRLLSPRLR